MLWQILIHTPKWVFAIFAMLILAGWQQSRARRLKPVVLLIVPIIMVILSYVGMRTSFGSAVALQLLWFAALCIFALAVGTYLPVSGVYQRDEYIFIPGSWVPLVVMQTIFLTKYAVGVTGAMAPELVKAPPFILSICTVYGACSGVFLGRAAAILLRARANNGQEITENSSSSLQ